MSDTYIDEFPEYWEITAPKITPLNQRIKNPSQEELIEQLKEYLLSFFETMYSKRPVFISSMWGYFMAVRGETPTVRVLIEEKQRIKYVKEGVEIPYNQKCFIPHDNEPTTDNYVNNKNQVLEGRKLRAEGNEDGYKKQKTMSIAVSGSAVYKLNTPNKVQENITYRNQLILIDIDLDSFCNLEEIFEKLKQDPYTKMVHLSFSGDGFVVIVEMSEIDAKKNFKLIFKKLEKYYKETYDITIDPSCSNIGRLRYISYDPNIYIKENVLISLNRNEIHAIEEKKLNNKLAKLNASELTQKNQSNNYKKTVTELTSELIANGLQNINGYSLWLSIAWSLHDHTNEWDLINDHRHREPYYSKLKAANITGAVSISIATFYKFCQDQGLSLYYKKPKNELTAEVVKSILTEISDEINKYKRVAGEVLEVNQFLSDKLPDLIELWLCTHINILVSPASSGKTTMVTKLREKSKRILLIVPTISIIKSKKPKDFAQVYGTSNIRDYVNTNNSIITTFDKASRLGVVDFYQFDYVIVDEFHMIFTETYRIRVIAPLLNIIKKSVLINRKNTLINSTKFVLMSGTPLGEDYLDADVDEQLTNKIAYINHKKRIANFVVCDNNNACYTSFINNAVKFIKNDYRVFIPSNAGEKWINSVVNVIANKIGYAPKYAVYSNNQRDSEENISINDTTLISKDNQLLFVTSLGNVGIDINNTEKTVMLVLDSKKTGYKAEQYVNRMRKIDVEVFVYFDRKKVDTKSVEFVWDYKLDKSEVKLLENSIYSDLYNNQKNDDLLIGTKVDHDKLKLRDYNKHLEAFHTNIICFGGYLKSMGYDVIVLWGEKEDKSMTEEHKNLLIEQDDLESKCKIRMVDFILSDPEELTRNFSNGIKRKSGGDNSFIDDVLMVENENIFNIIRGFVKRFVTVRGCFKDLDRWKNDMFASQMDFKQINNKLSFMEYVAKGGNPIEDGLIDEIDSFININDCKAHLTKVAFEKMINDFSPKYGNKSYNELDDHHQKIVRNELKEKLKVVYTIKETAKGVFFNQNLNQEWQKETYDFVLEIFKLSKIAAKIGFIEKRNRKGLAVGEAIGLAIGDAVGLSYQHITNEMINGIKKMANDRGFVTVQNVIDVTGLSDVGVGKFMGLKLPHLKKKRRTLNKVKKTVYVSDLIIL